MRVLFFIFGTVFLFKGQPSYAEDLCGEAKIVSGSVCSNLVVSFKLKECGGGEVEKAKVLCEAEGAKAILRKENATFSIPLREIGPGVWTLVGSLRRYPKDWVSDKKASALVVIRPASPAKANPESEGSVLEIGGQFRFRVEENRKRDLQNITGFSSVRARSGVVFRPSAVMNFQIMPQVVHILGKPELIASTPSSNSLTGTSGTNWDPQVGVHQAFGELSFRSFGRLIVGRQMVSYGDEVLVGLSDWENPGRSFDAIRLRAERETFWWDLFTAKVWDSNTQESAKGDKDFHGTYFSWTHPEGDLKIEPYLFWLRDNRVSVNQIYTTGLYTQLLLGSLEFKAEASGQWGDQTGQQIWGEVGSSWSSSQVFKVSADGFWASENFNPLFPSVHHLLGWADIFGRRNLAGLGLKLGWGFLPGYQVSLRAIHFLRVNTQSPSYAVDGITSLGFPSDSNQTLGSELDLRMDCALVPAVHLESAISIFLPSSSLKDRLGQTWVGRLETSLVASF